MSRLAWLYITGVLLLGLIFSVMALVGMNWPSSCLPTFISLTILATLSQLFEVVAPNRQSYYATLVFFFAGVFLLPPGLFVFLVSIPHLVELPRLASPAAADCAPGISSRSI
jgi:small basic protein